MKSFKFPQILIFAIATALLFAVSATFVFAYNPDPTHRLLTQKTAQIFGGFSQEEINWLIQGAIEEDIPPRWVNHFYDPKTGQGWDSQRMGNVPQSVLQTITNLGISRDPVSSLGWAHNQNLQAEYSAYKGDQTWETAVYHYVRWMDGKNKDDRKKAFVALGHILHLLQDLSVPAHTRQDTHSSGDPYEQWAAGFSSIDNLNFSQTMNCSTLDDCFIQMAKYSQENFFSKGTINDKEYPYPIADSSRYDGNIIIHFKNGYPLLIEKDGKLSVENNLIHSSYFQRLAPKAVTAGVSVLRIFFKEAELGFQFPQTVKAPLAAGLNIPRISALGELLRLDNLFQNIGQTAGQLLAAVFGSVPVSSPVVTPPLLASAVSPTPQATPKITPFPQTSPQIAAAPFIASPLSPTSPVSNPSSNSPSEVLGWQNTSNPAPVNIVSNLSAAPAPTPTPTPTLTTMPVETPTPESTPEPTIEPSPTPELTPEPSLTPEPTPEPTLEPPQITSHQDGQTVNEENITLAGTAEADSIIFIEYQSNQATTTVSVENQWQKEIILDAENEEHFITLWAQDKAGNQSANTSLILILRFSNPSTPPNSEPHLVISEIQISGQTPDDEFIEIYNPTGNDIDLSGYQLKRATNNGGEKSLVVASHFAGKSIKSKGYFLLAHQDYAGSVIPDFRWPESNKLAKDNSLILYDSEGGIVDKVGWGEKSKVFENQPFLSNDQNSEDGNPLENQSLGRKAFATSTAESMITGEHKDQGNGYDSDDNSFDFILRSTSDPQNSESPIEPPPAPVFGPEELIYDQPNYNNYWDSLPTDGVRAFGEKILSFKGDYQITKVSLPLLTSRCPGYTPPGFMHIYLHAFKTFDIDGVPYYPPMPEATSSMSSLACDPTIKNIWHDFNFENLIIHSGEPIALYPRSWENMNFYQYYANNNPILDGFLFYQYFYQELEYVSEDCDLAIKIYGRPLIY